MKKSTSLHRGHCFQGGVISRAVRCCFRLRLSLRGIENLLFERRVILTYKTIRHRYSKFGEGFAHPGKAVPGCTRHLDEVLVTLRGAPYIQFQPDDVLWRAVDEHGAELDVPVQKRRDRLAAKSVLRGMLR